MVRPGFAAPEYVLCAILRLTDLSTPQADELQSQIEHEHRHLAIVALAGPLLPSDAARISAVLQRTTAFGFDHIEIKRPILGRKAVDH